MPPIEQEYLFFGCSCIVLISFLLRFKTSFAIMIEDVKEVNFMPDYKKTSHKNEKEEMEEHADKKGKKGGSAQAQGPNVMGAAVMGAIAGAAVGVAASMALSDEKTRQKASEFMGDMRDKAADRISEMTHDAKKSASKASDALPEPMKTTAKKVLEEDKDKAA